MKDLVIYIHDGSRAPDAIRGLPLALEYLSRGNSREFHVIQSPIPITDMSILNRCFVYIVKDANQPASQWFEAMRGHADRLKFKLIFYYTYPVIYPPTHSPIIPFYIADERGNHDRDTARDTINNIAYCHKVICKTHEDKQTLLRALTVRVSVEVVEEYIPRNIHGRLPDKWIQSPHQMKESMGALLHHERDDGSNHATTVTKLETFGTSDTYLTYDRYEVFKAMFQRKWDWGKCWVSYQQNRGKSAILADAAKWYMSTRWLSYDSIYDYWDKLRTSQIPFAYKWYADNQFNRRRPAGFLWELIASGIVVVSNHGEYTTGTDLNMAAIMVRPDEAGSLPKLRAHIDPYRTSPSEFNRERERQFEKLIERNIFLEDHIHEVYSALL